MTIAKVAEFLRLKDDFLLSTHVNPDGDGIGSIIGLVGLLKKLEKSFKVILQDAVPKKLTFLGYTDEFEVFPGSDPSHKFPDAIIVDSPSFERIGSVAGLLADDAEVINIDHHISNENFGLLNLVYPDLSSSAQVVLLLYKELGFEMDKASANGLYAGICTDTGHFRFSNTTVEVLSDSAWCVKAGADPELIATKLYFEMNIETTIALSKMLGSIELHNGGTVATAYLDNDFLTSKYGLEADTEGFANHPLSLLDVDVAFFMKENQPGNWRVNLRSKKDEINVNDIASSFGGGGHPRASGATIQGTLEEVKQNLVDTVS
jgi:phosphoesterase RecJ-like protein